MNITKYRTHVGRRRPSCKEEFLTGFLYTFKNRMQRRELQQLDSDRLKPAFRWFVYKCSPLIDRTTTDDAAARLSLAQIPEVQDV